MTSSRTAMSIYIAAWIGLTSGMLGLIIPFQGLQVWNPNMKHTYKQAQIPPPPPASHTPIYPLQVISGSRQT